MEIAEIETKVMQEIKLVPKDRLQELYDFIHFFRLGLETVVDDTEEIMRFAGCWQDMTRKEFENFSEEIAERRKQAFLGRTARETVIA
ncbi:hypothetical protein QUF75_09885 [Desulfococcaceae bacterium HSG7]|nr:hypothetical protein [Desulfococcaceae bacterium HSG9]MDM8555026.1 hypothetical protein [Desulfococcaceae bacterium HSG7]